MAPEPLIADPTRLILDHHHRLAVVEVEARETRNDVSELRGDVHAVAEHLHQQDVAWRAGVGEITTSVANLASEIKPIIAAAALRQQQSSTLLVYGFSASLSMAGGLFGAWLSSLARLSAPAQAAVLAGSSVVCFLAARIVLARAHRS